MIPRMKPVKLQIFSGNASPQFTQVICDSLGERMGKSKVSRFADGEISCSFFETMRGMDVFLVNSTCKPVNDHLMELLVMIDACKRASAGRITAVIPYFGYARQDRKAKPRDPISAKLVADMLQAAGAHRILTLDLHCPQIQGFFNIPVDVLRGMPLFVDYYIEKFGDKRRDMVAVAPDAGSAGRVRNFADAMNMNMAIVDKRRERANESEVMNIVGDVKDREVILFDDLLDTAGTLCGAAKALVEDGGAKVVYACASHPVLSYPAKERIEKSVITELAVLDTIPIEPDNMPQKLTVLGVAPLFGDAIRRTYNEEPISDLYYENKND